MNESMPEENGEPTRSQMKYRVQFRNRNGLQGREAMIVCQNFRVTADERFFYVSLRGDIRIVALSAGDYFDVKVMG